MIIPLTLLFGGIGYLYYQSKVEVSLIEEDKQESLSEKIDHDDTDNYLEDLFI